MEVYPLNLILAVATASATIFLGFLPTKNISSAFFAREIAKAIIAWVIVAITSPFALLQYLLFLAFLCFASWWHFRRDRGLNGKMWLSLASGLGISIGVMFIIAVTPYAKPPGLPELNETLLLASIYLGGAVIGLAYVCFALIANPSSGVTQNLIQRYVGLLFYLTIARAAVLLLEAIQGASPANDRVFGLNGLWNDGTPTQFSFTTLHAGPYLLLPALVLIIIAFLAQRAAGFSSRVQPTRFLFAIIGLGFLTEIIARILVL